MRFKLSLLIISISLLSMNLYSRALRHINMNDAKQKHHQKLTEQKIQEEIDKREKEFIASVMEEKKYDWRKKLNEGMTSSGTFFTTLPATGDVNLAYPEWNDLGGYNYSISGGTVTITNSGTPGPESGVAASFDTSLYDTLVIDVGFSGNTILGVFPSGSGGPLLVTTSPGTYNISIPGSKNQVLVFLSATLSVGTVTINNLRFQRRTPMNVVVPLNSPEATSFIRAEPNLSNLSPAERLQKLKEMLEASDEYVMKMLGVDFPGTGAVPPGEFDPFAQTPPGEAGDTPGVEIAGGYGLRPDGTSGMNKVGDKVYDPNTKKEYELVPSNKYGGGTQWQPVRQASDSSQDTQIAQALPIEPAQQRRGATGVGIPDTTGTSPGSNLPPKSQMNYPKEWLPKQAQKKQTTMVAHYEPEGQVISEKKLKPPQEVLGRIPGYYDGKPAPLGFPIEPPPKMVNGMHPDLVDGKKAADRFNRLDPESARAMPFTGNPHIDKKIKAARKNPK